MPVNAGLLRKVLGDPDLRKVRESEPTCGACRRKPSQIAEYIDAAGQEEMSETMYVVHNEGTFNPKTNRFLCTEDYVRAGMPTNDDGTPWQCP